MFVNGRSRLTIRVKSIRPLRMPIALLRNSGRGFKAKLMNSGTTFSTKSNTTPIKKKLTAGSSRIFHKQER